MGIQCKKVRQNVNYNNVCETKLPPNERNHVVDEVTPTSNTATAETNRFRCQHVGEQQLRSLRSSQPTPSPMPQSRPLAAVAPAPAMPTTTPPSPLPRTTATKCVQNEQAELHMAQQQSNECDRCHNNDKERKIRSKKAPSSSLKISIANKIIARFTQLISFNQDHKSSASSYTNAVTIAPTNKTNTNHNNDIDIANFDRIEESANTNDRNNSTKHKYNNNRNNNNSVNTHSQYFIRQSLSLYAASGFLLALCYLVIPAAASIDTPHPM